MGYYIPLLYIDVITYPYPKLDTSLDNLVTPYGNMELGQHSLR